MSEGTEHYVGYFDNSGCDEYIQTFQPIDGGTGNACYDARGPPFKSFEVTLQSPVGKVSYSPPGSGSPY